MDYYSLIRRNEIPIHGKTWMNLESLMLSEKQKATWCIVLFTWNVQKIEIHRDRKQRSCCQGRGVGGWGGMGGSSYWVQAFLLGWLKCYRTRQWWWMPSIANVLNATEFYPLKWLREWLLCYVYFTPIFFMLCVFYPNLFKKVLWIWGKRFSETYF